MKNLKNGLRLGGSIENMHADLGPLSELVGTWMGNSGFNIVFVPDTTNGFKHKLLAREYTELITFTPVQSPVPNRSGNGPTQYIAALLYQLTICDKKTMETMHVENGMWLHLMDKDQGSCIVRQTSVPHGNVFCAIGGWENVDGAPDFIAMNPLPNGVPAEVEHPDGYNAKIGSLYREGTANNVIALKSQIESQNILNTRVLSVSTDSDKGGGIVSIPFIDKNVPTPSFSSVFYIEEVEGENGNNFMQLQYTQNTAIKFLDMKGSTTDPKEKVLWPHINFNTLRKV